jgi:hypothetical protein
MPVFRLGFWPHLRSVLRCAGSLIAARRHVGCPVQAKRDLLQRVWIVSVSFSSAERDSAPLVARPTKLDRRH